MKQNQIFAALWILLGVLHACDDLHPSGGAHGVDVGEDDEETPPNDSSIDETSGLDVTNPTQADATNTSTSPDADVDVPTTLDTREDDVPTLPGDTNQDQDTEPDLSKPPVCGDGIIAASEGCDDGNNSTTDACPDGPEGACQPAYCGDGFVLDGSEVCDTYHPSNSLCDATCNATCDLYFADCNLTFSDGCEASLLSDPLHCGACGHTCGGSFCVEGVCQPILMRSEQESSIMLNKSLARYEDHLFYATRWVDWPEMDPSRFEDQLHRVHRERTDLDFSGHLYSRLSGQQRIQNLQVSGSDLFWLDLESASLKTCPATEPANCVATSILEGLAGVSDYALNEQFIYWSDPLNGQIKRKRRDSDDPPEDFILGLNTPKALALDDQNLYVMDWFDGDNSARILRFSTTEIPAQSVVLAQTSGCGPIIVHSGEVFWTNTSCSRPDEALIASVPVDGGDVTIYRRFPFGIVDFVVDQDFVYCSLDSQDEGLLLKIRRQGVEETQVLSRETFLAFSGGASFYTFNMFLVFSGPLAPNGIAADDSFIYWTQQGIEHVLRIAH